MKKFLALFAAAAFVTTACTKKAEEVPAEVPVEEAAPEVPADAAPEAPAEDAASSEEAK